MISRVRAATLFFVVAFLILGISPKASLAAGGYHGGYSGGVGYGYRGGYGYGFRGYGYYGPRVAFGIYPGYYPYRIYPYAYQYYPYYYAPRVVVVPR